MSAEVDIAALCSARGWSRARLILELRQVASQEGIGLPGDESLKRMIRQWVNHSRIPSDLYYRLLCRAFRIPVDPATQVVAAGLGDRVGFAVDEGLVLSLEDQTASLRALDLRMGGARLNGQAAAHARTVADMVSWAPPGPVRAAAAAAGAEAAALAGWQVLDLGSTEGAWRWHEVARELAQEAGDPSVTAHVTAQQGYALLDEGRTAEAVEQMAAARAAANGSVPGVLAAWLAAAEAEARAANGERDETLRLLDHAYDVLDTTQVPYLALDEMTLLRWRGHCLARLGEESAVTDLGKALEGVDQQWIRARSGLHADLALALALRGERDVAVAHAEQVRVLAASTGSVRQRDRLRLVLGDPEGQDVQQGYERP